MRLLLLTAMCLALALLSACPKNSATEADTTTSVADNLPKTVPDRAGTDGEDFMAEPEVKSLAQSPLNLSGVSLGVSPDFHGGRYQERDVELEQEWREEGRTGIQWRSFEDEAGAVEEASYFNEGHLVAFQRIEGQDEAGFDERIGLIGVKYGDPWSDLPDYVTGTVAYEDFLKGDPDRTVFWVDPPTQTVIAGKYDADVAAATWMLFQPEQLVAVRGEVMAAMGS